MHRNRAKQASYVDRHLAQNCTNNNRNDQESYVQDDTDGDCNNDEDEEYGELHRKYVTPARKPEKIIQTKQPSRVRQEPKFHKETKNKSPSSVKQDGNMRKFKSLDDIPDYDAPISNAKPKRNSPRNNYDSDSYENDHTSPHTQDSSVHRGFKHKYGGDAMDEDAYDDNAQYIPTELAKPSRNLKSNYQPQYSVRDEPELEPEPVPVPVVRQVSARPPAHSSAQLAKPKTKSNSYADRFDEQHGQSGAAGVSVRKINTPQQNAMANKRIQQQEPNDSGIRWQSVKGNEKVPPLDQPLDGPSQYQNRIISNVKKTTISKEPQPLPSSRDNGWGGGEYEGQDGQDYNGYSDVRDVRDYQQAHFQQQDPYYRQKQGPREDQDPYYHQKQGPREDQDPYYHQKQGPREDQDPYYHQNQFDDEEDSHRMQPSPRSTSSRSNRYLPSNDNRGVRNVPSGDRLKVQHKGDDIDFSDEEDYVPSPSGSKRVSDYDYDTSVVIGKKKHQNVRDQSNASKQGYASNASNPSNMKRSVPVVKEVKRTDQQLMQMQAKELKIQERERMKGFVSPVKNKMKSQVSNGTRSTIGHEDSAAHSPRNPHYRSKGGGGRQYIDSYEDSNTSLSPEQRRQQKTIQEHQVYEDKKEQLAYSKQRRDVEYKPYTLKQYRNIKPKEYVEIPNLKPDLNREELKAKRANLDRMKEFSKNLNNVNKTVISEQRKLPPSKEARDIKVNQEAQCSSRLRALEFSRNIPKPRVVKKESAGEARSKKQNQYNEMEMEMEDDDYYVTADDIYGADYATNSKMQALDNKHNDTKKQVDAIKKSLGLMK